jgi:hypothetical protein
MPPFAAREAAERLAETLRQTFPDTSMETSVRAFDSHAEIWVYVLDSGQYQAVAAECDRIQARHDQGIYPFLFIPKTWTGPWPGGDKELELQKERRQAFKERFSKQKNQREA